MDKVILHSITEKEKNLYSALCLELDVASQGKTITAAKKNLKEAVAVYLEDVIHSGEVKDFVPRPAPRAEWIKFFKAEAKTLGRKLKNFPLRKHFKLEDIVYSAS